MGEFYDPPDQTIRDIKEYDVYDQKIQAFRRSITESDAVQLSNVARYYFGISPDLAAATVQSGMDWQDPLLAEISFDDAKAQEDKNWAEQAWGHFKSGVRVAATAVEGVWDESILTAGGRTGINIAQGQNPLEAWKNAGASDAALAASAALQGEEVNLGSGFLPESTLAQDTPGYGNRLQEEVREEKQFGAPPMETLARSRQTLDQKIYGEIGDPITQVGRASREAPKMVKVVNGKRYEVPWSLGRGAALLMFTPETIPFNITSGSIDTAARIGFDPINMPADEIAHAWKASKLLLPAEAGADMERYWRPWRNSKTVDTWFNSKHGVKTMQGFADEMSFQKVHDLLGDIPEAEKLRVARAVDPDEVRDILRPWLGGPKHRTAPTFRKGYVRGPVEALGSVVHDQMISKFDPLENIASRWGARIRRAAAESGEALFTPHDPDRSIHTARQYLKTMRTSPERTDEILSFMAANDAGDYLTTQRKALEMIRGEAVEELTRIGYDKTDVLELMKDWDAKQAVNNAYLQNFVGEPIKIEGGLQMEFTNARTGEKFKVNIESATSEAEFASHVVALPNMRDTRRFTSVGRARKHTLRTKLKLHLPGQSPHLQGMAAGRVTAKMDLFQAIWKNSVLLRGGWPLRVISEELVRMQGSGYSQLMNNPLSYFALSLKHPQIVGIDGAKTLRDVFDELGGLGAGGFQSDIKNLPKVQGVGRELGRQNWDTISLLDDAGAVTPLGAEALSNQLLLYQGSLLRQEVAGRGVEGAIKYLTENPAGQKIVRDILTDPRTPKSEMFKLEDVGQLRKILQSMEFDMAIHMGGNGWYIEADDMGRRIWRNREGVEVEDVLAWDMETQKQWLVDNDVAGRSYATNSKERAELIWEAKGEPNFNALNAEGRQFVTPDLGDQGLRNLVAYGDETMDGRVTLGSRSGHLTDAEKGEIMLFKYGETSNPAGVRWNDMTVEELATERVRLVGEADPEQLSLFDTYLEGLEDFATPSTVPLPEGNPLWAAMDEGQLRTEWARLMNEGEMDEAALLSRIHSERLGPEIPDMDISDVPREPGVTRMDDATRNSRKGAEFQAWVKDYYDKAPFRPPEKMKTASVTLEQRKQGYAGKATDWVFEQIMTNPTNRAVRGPYATLRYTEEIAIASLWAPNDVVNQLRQWAIDNGMTQYFDDFVKKAMKERGLKSRPVIADDAKFSFEEIDEWAKTVAVSDTKELFFNVAERGNWSDMTRFMAPFAEAWWEVISRWSDMLGIKSTLGLGTFKIGNPGQAIRNWERGRQTIEGARRSGFFQEDRFGSEAFFFPSIGNLWPGLEQWRGSMSLNSLMFIDPSLRGVGLPGAGPYWQIGSSFIVPLIPDFPLVGSGPREVAEAVSYGGFPAPERSIEGMAEALSPTWGKKAFNWLKSPEQRGQNADNVGVSLGVLLQLRAQNGQAPPTEDEMHDLKVQAQQQGSTLSFFQFIESLALPASVNYEPSLLIRDLQESGSPNFWLSALALKEEYRIASDVFEDPQLGQAYIAQRFGVDPLNLASKTKAVLQRPYDENRYRWIEANQDAVRFAPTTLVGLIPQEAGDDFYSPAWDQAVRDGTVEYLSVDATARLLTNAKADIAWRAITEQYKEEKVWASHAYGVGSEAYNLRVDELDEWKELQRKDVESVYYDWAPGIQATDPGVYGAVDPPTYGDQWDELMEFTVPGLAADWLAEANPEMLNFLEHVNYLFETAGESSIAVGEALGTGYKDTWWRDSQAETYGESTDNKQAIVQWVVDGLEHYVNTTEMTKPNQLNVRWMIQSIFGRMIRGWEFDEVRLIVPEDIPLRSRQRLEGFDVSDTIDEIPAPLTDDEVDQYQEEVPSYE